MTTDLAPNSLRNALLNPRPIERQVTHVRMQLAGLFGLGGQSFEHIELLAGAGWVKTRAEVASDILQGDDYYTNRNALGLRAYLEVVQLGLSKLYVRTKADCTTENNLLNLPRF